MTEYLNSLTDALELLKEQEEEIENLKQTAQSMMEGICLLKEQKKIKSQEEFSKIIHGMFDHLWDCEIEHPIFQDTVGDLMNAVIQAYGQAVKWE